MNAILDDAARRARLYLESLPERPVRPQPEAVAALARLDEPLPARSGDPHETLAFLDEYVTPATMAMAGPRFFGFVIGGSIPVTLAANWMAGGWDQNAGLYTSTPGVARLEQVALRWLVELFDLPAGAGAAFVTGATVANFTALAAARNGVLDCWCGGTVWQEQTAMRISVCNWSTTDEDVERSLAVMSRLARELG